MLTRVLLDCLRVFFIHLKLELLTQKLNYLINPLTSRPGCMPESRYTGVRVLFFVI